MLSENIAKICHQANKAYCETIGDLSQVDWSDAPEWQKNSAINGVEFIFKNSTAPESSSHDSWLKEKLENGWKYGPIKDVEKKEHPCCVSYQELPDTQKMKDYIFKSIVMSFIKSMFDFNK